MAVARWLLGGAAVLAGGLALLVLQTSPSVPPAPTPGATQVMQGRKAFTRFRIAVVEGDGQLPVRLSAADVDSIAALAGRGLGVKRTAARIGPDGAVGAMSIDLPAGLWLNLSVRALPAATGFPPLELRAGDLVISGGAARLLVQAGRQLLVWRGLPLQPIDRMVQGLEVDAQRLRLQPGPGMGQTGLVSGLIGLGGEQVDQGRVQAIYCALAQRQREQPSTDLAVHVQRMIAATRAGSAAQAVAEHRDGLVALALLVAGRGALSLSNSVQSPFAACPLPAARVVLAGRPDLAKHWTISAALAAVGGVRTGRLLGEWKELADSMAGGSGFSFADLAADRAGLKVGTAATDRATALALRADLQTRGNAGLLPETVLGLAEGMSEARFVARYRDTDSARFAAAVAEIDRLLAAGNAPGAAIPAG